jgi:hypothetical protein
MAVSAFARASLSLYSKLDLLSKRTYRDPSFILISLRSRFAHPRAGSMTRSLGFQA